jgi:hypothetical protein
MAIAPLVIAGNTHLDSDRRFVRSLQPEYAQPGFGAMPAQFTVTADRPKNPCPQVVLVQRTIAFFFAVAHQGEPIHAPVSCATFVNGARRSEPCVRGALCASVAAENGGGRA